MTKDEVNNLINEGDNNLNYYTNVAKNGGNNLINESNSEYYSLSNSTKDKVN
jgi:hypothetical protein